MEQKIQGKYKEQKKRLKNNIKVDYFLASEAGITNMLGDWIDINIAVVEDNEGLSSVGTSQGFPIPDSFYYGFNKTY